LTDKLADYRKHAQECRSLARSTLSEEERKQLLIMAETWESLAAERERRLKVGNQPSP
jgi:hypothetical protein